MFPIIFLGVAAVALISGCSRPSSEKKADPRGPLPPQSPAVPDSAASPSQPAVEVPNSRAIAGQPQKAEPPAEKTPKRKLTPQELQDLGEKLRACLKVQRRYGFSCPPPAELPPGCSCQEVELPRELDPNTPRRFRQQMLQQKTESPGPLQI